MRGKQSGPEAMEEPRRAFDTNPSTTALEVEPEPVSETDVCTSSLTHDVGHFARGRALCL